MKQRPRWFRRLQCTAEDSCDEEPQILAEELLAVQRPLIAWLRTARLEIQEGRIKSRSCQVSAHLKPDARGGRRAT